MPCNLNVIRVSQILRLSAPALLFDLLLWLITDRQTSLPPGVGLASVLGKLKPGRPVPLSTTQVWLNKMVAEFAELPYSHGASNISVFAGREVTLPANLKIALAC